MNSVYSGKICLKTVKLIINAKSKKIELRHKCQLILREHHVTADNCDLQYFHHFL